MMKYIELKGGKFVAEHVISSIGVEGDEIFVYFTNGTTVSKAHAAQTEPHTIDSVIVALRRRIAEKKE